MSRIILICGVPGSGKSGIARIIAKKFGVQFIVGTDIVREIVRSYTPKEKLPVLHNSAILSDKYFKNTKDPILSAFIEQSKIVKPGMEAVIRRSIKEGKDLIMEGIHLIPGILEIKNVEIVHFVLNIECEKLHKRQLEGQGNHRSWYKIENMEKARHFQKYLVEQARKYNIEIVDKVEYHDDFENNKVINEMLDICKNKFGN